MNSCPTDVACDPLPPTTIRHRVIEINDSSGFEPYQKAWDELSEAASETNVYYAHWALRPALERLCDSNTVKVLLFLRDDGSQQPRLDGVVPLMTHRPFRFFPFLNLRSFKHIYCPCTVPLLRRAHESNVVRSFGLWIKERRYRHSIVHLHAQTADGPWVSALRNVLSTMGLQIESDPPVQRALLGIQGQAEDYLQRAIPSKKRKEYRRLRERLAEQGDVQICELMPGDPKLQLWLDEFVELERKGWKGQTGSALGCKSENRAFFEETAKAAYARGQLLMLKMSLNDQPLAMICDFLAPPVSFSFKTTYDEDFARFSPGALLELENACLAHGRTSRGLQWIDSCASPTNELINRLYPERKTMCDLTIASGHPLSNLFVRCLFVLKRLKRRLKELKKS